MILSLIFPAILLFANRWFLSGNLDLSAFAGAAIGLAVVLSSFIATMVCRRAGVSQDKREWEVMKRGFASPQPEATTTFEIRHSAKIWGGFALSFALFSLLTLVLVLGLPAKAGTQVYGFLLVGGFGLFAIIFWLAYFYNFGLIGRADEIGVKGYDQGYGQGGFAVKSVNWDEIESCEITSIYNALGQLARTLFVFKDERELILLKISVGVIPPEQIAQFKATVGHYLSTVKS